MCSDQVNGSGIDKCEANCFGMIDRGLDLGDFSDLSVNQGTA